MKSTANFVKRDKTTQIAIAIIAVGIVATIGYNMLSSSHAQSPYISVYAADGKITGTASLASGGTNINKQAVQFGSATSGSVSPCSVTTALAVYVCNGQLVNGQLQPIQLRGVNVTGTEDLCDGNLYPPWTPAFSWGASSTQAEATTSANAMKAWDINAVRIPLNEDCWLGINSDTASTAYSGASYQANIKAWVNTLNAAGIVTILDLHWSAPGTTIPVQQWPMADADHSVAFWTSVATAFKSNPAVIFDLFNEPYIGISHLPTASDWSCWLNGCWDSADAKTAYQTAGMQQLLSTVRVTGATQPVMVGGITDAGNPCLSDGTSQSCPQVANMPTDGITPQQLVISFHNYPTNKVGCTTTTCWNTLSAAATSAKLPIVTGEFGDIDNTTANYITSYIKWADTKNVSYLAWTWQTGCGQFQLIKDWAGTPCAPQGTALQQHFMCVYNNPGNVQSQCDQ